MEELAFLLALLAFALGVVAAAEARKLRREIEALKLRLDESQRRDVLLPVRQTEAEKVTTAPVASLGQEPVPAAPVDERELLPPRPAAIPPPLPVTPPLIPRTPPIPAVTPFNWEAFMGVKLFAWLGGFALFLGMVFLIKYSFENNLITPLGRIAIGAVVALCLIGTGWWLARGRYRITAQSLCATGIVILYADIFAAQSFYQLISLTSAFFAMSAVTLGSFLLAVNLDAQVVAILGLLGGFLTPALLPSGNDNAPALFLYLALLDLGIAAVALRKGWAYLLLCAALGTSATQLGWAGRFFNLAKGGRAFWIFLGFEAFFVALYFWRRWTGGSSSLRRDSPRRVQTFDSAFDLPDKWAISAICVAGLTALGFAVWLFFYPLLARQPLYFFSFVFLADAGLLAVPVFTRTYRVIAIGAGSVTFALSATWIAMFASQAPLSGSLIAIVVFAFLHAVTTPASAWRPRLLPFTAMGTLTPFLLLYILMEKIEPADPSAIFVVAFLLCAILLVAAIVRQSDWLAGAALAGIGFLELVWQSNFFTSEAATAAFVCYTVFLLLFVLYPFCSAEKDKAWPWAIGALAQALQFWLFYQALTRALPNDRMGLLPAAFILPAALGVIALLKLYHATPASGDVRLAWQGGALLLFVSLIFPLQFDREWITLGWAVEGLALLWLFRCVPHRGLVFVGTALLCAAFVRLALNPAVLEYHKRTGVRIWNWYLYAYGITSSCLFLGAWLSGKRDARSAGDNVPGYNWSSVLLGSLGVILGFILLNLEIADYFSIGPTLTFSFQGNFARDMTYSIAWALFALGLIVAGMRLGLRAARYAGVALLVVTLAKLFLRDLSDLNELYRIGAFVGVAIILIAASFIYQRFLATKPGPE